MNDWLGAHMSIAGGLDRAIDRGIAAGCGVIQIFTQNSNQWRGKIPTSGDADIFRGKMERSGLHAVVSHDIYLINLAAAAGEVRSKSLAAFREEMLRCGLLGIDEIVMHPGSHLGEGEAEGIRRIAAAFDELFATTPEFTGTILLETTAGQGTNLGYTFEQLREIIDATRFPERFGVCFDTCHTYAAGYDTTTREGYDRTFERFDEILGLPLLRCFHLNDSKKGLGSRIDRHEHIGQGVMGLEPFRFLLNDPRFATVPKILETPKGEHDEMDEVNLRILRGLVEGNSSGR
ncbi:MAG: deoxyribonuclease IV [Desulfuromonadia bacterium]